MIPLCFILCFPFRLNDSFGFPLFPVKYGAFWHHFAPLPLYKLSRLGFVCNLATFDFALLFLALPWTFLLELFLLCYNNARTC